MIKKLEIVCRYIEEMKTDGHAIKMTLFQVEENFLYDIEATDMVQHQDKDKLLEAIAECHSIEEIAEWLKSKGV